MRQSRTIKPDVRRNLRRQLALHQVALFAVGLVICVAKPVVAASTEPIRNKGANQTHNPPDALHPIYYPISPSKSSADQNVPPEEILRLFMDRHTAMDYPAAAELAMRLISVIPDRPEGHYNLACAMARLRRNNEALDALQRAIDLGWRDAEHISLDPDLNSIRHDQRFVSMWDDLKAKLDQARIQPCPLRSDEWEIVAADLQSKVPEIMTEHQVPGSTVVLVRDGGMVWSSSFGVRDRRASDLLTAHDRFRVRAPLHLVALVAAGQQQTAGRMNLAKLLRDGIELDESARPVNAASAPAPGSVRPIGRSAPADEKRSRKAACVEPRQPNYSSNSVYGLIRLATEMSSSMAFPDYCQRAIFDPLQMNNTAVGTRQGELFQVVVGHSKLGSPMEPNPASDELVKGGSLLTTAEDLAKLMCEAIHSEGAVETLAAHEALETEASRLQARRDEIGRSGQVETEAHVCAPALFTLVSRVNQETRRGLGLALDVRDTDYGTRVQVADTVSGLGCMMRWYPQSKCGVVVLYNSANGREAAERIAHIALGGEQ